MPHYYKISREWTERLGETQTAPRHPDGMHLVLPQIGSKVSEILARQTGNPRLLPADALAAIGAIPLTVAEARASQRGELRHDIPRESQQIIPGTLPENLPEE